MTRDTTLPGKPVHRFIELHVALTKERGWLGNAASLRYAALSAITCPGDGDAVARAIRTVAADLKERAGWFGEMNSPLRFILAAILVQHKDTVVDFLNEVDRVRELFRAEGLRRGGVYEVMAILVLRLQHAGKPITVRSIKRLKALYEEMKRHHWWLTGPDDYPACAILAMQRGEPRQIGDDIEALYRALEERGAKQGDPLQTAANVLYLARRKRWTAAERFHAMRRSFEAAGVPIHKADYEELAVLSFLDHPSSRIIKRALEIRDQLGTLDPAPEAQVTLSLACSLTFMELIQLDRNMKNIIEAKAMLDMQAFIAAQQAAMVEFATAGVESMGKG